MNGAGKGQSGDFIYLQREKDAIQGLGMREGPQGQEQLRQTMDKKLSSLKDPLWQTFEKVLKT